MPRDGWARRNRLQNNRLKSTGETPAMLIGVPVPNIGPPALTDAAVEIAEHAEQQGFASVWTVEHRRAAKRGDGWHLIDMEPSEIAASRALLAEDCRAAGRAPDEVPVSMYASLLIAERDLADNGRQFPLMASIDRIVAKLAAYRAAGLDHIVLAARGLNTLKEYKELFDLIVGQILPRLENRP